MWLLGQLKNGCPNEIFHRGLMKSDLTTAVVKACGIVDILIRSESTVYGRGAFLAK
jgi:hypothetical protein